MSKVLCLAHQKGGVGKSTIALNLAYCFQNGLKVGIVDTDQQGSLKGLELETDGIDLLPFEDDVSKMKSNNYDLIIIDTPPYLSNKLPEIFLASDIVIIPTRAGFFDLMAIKATIAMVKVAQEVKKELKAGIVFNMIKHNSSISNEIKGLIDEDTIPVLKSVITDRISYTRSIINGGIYNTNDEKAKTEITNLADEILRILGF